MAALSTPLFTASMLRGLLLLAQLAVIRQYLTFTEAVQTYNGVRLFVPDQLIGPFSVLLIGWLQSKVLLATSSPSKF